MSNAPLEYIDLENVLEDSRLIEGIYLFRDPEAIAVAKDQGYTAADWNFRDAEVCGHSIVYVVTQRSNPYFVEQHPVVADRAWKLGATVYIVELPECGSDMTVAQWLKSPRWRNVGLDQVARSSSETVRWRPADDRSTERFQRDPQPLESVLSSVPELDPLLIPDAFRGWLADIADRSCLPVEYPTAAAIVAAGAVIGRKVAMKPKRFDSTWILVPNLWGGIVGPPGVMKSYAAEEGLKPLHRLEAEARERHEAAIKTHHAELMVIEAQVDAKKAELKKLAKSGADQDQMSLLAAEIAAMEEQKTAPTASRYLVNDVTIEKLGELLRENPNGMTMFRDELVGFLRTMDKQGHENDRQFYLESWSGTLPFFTYDRIARGTIVIPNPTMSLFGGIQPGPLTRYIRGASFGSNEDDGLIQRFQILVYPDIGAYKHVDRPPDVDAKNRAFDVFRALDSMEPIAAGIPIHPDKGIPCCEFDEEAQPFFDEWLTTLENRIRAKTEDGRLVQHIAKYRGLMPSLAMLFHLIENHVDLKQGRVSLRTAKAAAAWCDFLESHARRIYQAATDGDIETAINLSGRIKTTLPTPFTFRQVAQKGWAGLSDVESVRKAVGYLEDRGWVRVVEVEPGPKGGRPSEEVHVNPRVLKAALRASA